MSLARVSALEAAIELVAHLDRFPEVDADQAIHQLRSGSAEAATLDYDRGLRLLELVGPDAVRISDFEQRQAILARVVAFERPAWRLGAAKGKKWCLDAMDGDTQQALAWAGLVGSTTTRESVIWWDRLADEVRGLGYAARLAAGREGERLTMEHERDRLVELGIDREPKWRALDDNTLGYDIDSWDLVDGQIQPLRIEVKAFSGSRPEFFLSREEWETARRFPDRYVFDVWDLATSKHRRILAATLDSRLPGDTDVAEWRRALVAIARL